MPFYCSSESREKTSSSRRMGLSMSEWNSRALRASLCRALAFAFRARQKRTETRGKFDAINIETKEGGPSLHRDAGQG